MLGSLNSSCEVALEIAIALSVLTCLASLNAWATYKVLRDPLSTRGQQAAQAAFVWMLPIIGGLLVLRIKSDQAEPPTGKYRGAVDPGDDYGLSGRSDRHDGGSHHESPTASSDGHF